MTVRILQGDCREVMATLPEASVDAIVCDPPYELGFMGKGWDRSGVANDVDTWRQALRVLKPGGHLLAFSGTRTYHRMTCAIEDAGFEVRDQIQWIYAAGFPKSMNLDNLRGEAICGCEPSSERGVRSVRGADVSPAFNYGEERGEVLQPSVQEQSAPAHGEARRVSGDAGAAESCVAGRRDASASQGELCLGAVCPGAGVGAADGSARRLRDGASPRHGDVVRLSADSDGGRAPRRSRPAAERAREPGALAGQPQPQAGGAWPVCGGCGLPVLPRGLGTALKPAHEPIVVARRPLTGTVAANVLQHGTGALNVDGCRVGIDADERGVIDKRSGSGQSTEGWGHIGNREVGETYKSHTLGRWPANVILSYPADEYRLRDDVTPDQLEEVAGWLRANA